MPDKVTFVGTKVLFADGNKVAMDVHCCCGTECSVSVTYEQASVYKTKCWGTPTYDMLGLLVSSFQHATGVCGYTEPGGPDPVYDTARGANDVYRTYVQKFTGCDGGGTYVWTGVITITWTCSRPDGTLTSTATGSFTDQFGDVVSASATIPPPEDYSAEGTLSNLYTTAQLYTDALAMMPAYAPGDNAASKTLSPDEIDLSLTKLKVTITPTPTTATVTWNQVFTPAGGGAPTTTPGSHVGTTVIEIIPVLADPDGAWSIEDITCHL